MTTPSAGQDASATPPDRLRERERDALDEAVRRFSFLAGDVRPALAHRLGLSPTELRAVEHVMTAPMGPVELARRLGLTSAAATTLVRRLEGRGHLERSSHPQDGRRLGLTSAAATTLVRRLEGRGHLERSSHPQDGRRIELRATAHSYTEVAAVLVPLFDGLQAAREGMSAQDRDVVTRYLETVSEIIEGHLRGPWRRRDRG